MALFPSRFSRELVDFFYKTIWYCERSFELVVSFVCKLDRPFRWCYSNMFLIYGDYMPLREAGDFRDLLLNNITTISLLYIE